MKIVTMRGKTLDMAALIARNPQTVAVGNASMNARGDIITRHGTVVKAREQIAMEYHASNPRSVKNVGIKSLSSEMFASPAEAWAEHTQAKQSEVRQTGAKQAEATSAGTTPVGTTPVGTTPVGTTQSGTVPEPSSYGQTAARRRKLIDPADSPDGGV